MEKKALCTSCHDYSNVRPPLLRGNSYQEDAIAEEPQPEANELAVVEVHTCECARDSCTCELQQPPSTLGKEIAEQHDIPRNINAQNTESKPIEEASADNNPACSQENIEGTKHKDVLEFSNGKNLNSQEEENTEEISIETNIQETVSNVNHSVGGDMEIKVNKVHELANLFEHGEELNKAPKLEQEDLDNSFEKEFKNRCKEITNIARHSLIKNVCDDSDKEGEPLRRFDSESTLQLSDVETETCPQNHMTSYVNINTFRTTNL